MRATVDIKEFMANPTGQYIVGGSWIYWCVRPSLFGLALWGRPSADDVRSLINVLRVELGDGIVPHASLIDASRLEGVDGDAFEALNAYVQTNHQVLSERVTRLALVRSAGMAGAVTAGFYEVTGAPYPVELVDTVDEGLQWLEGAPNPELSATIAAICSEVVGAILDSSVMDAVSLLRDLIVDDQAPAAARIKAAQMVLDRGGVGPSYTVEIENTAKTAEEMTPLQQALLIVEHYDAAKALILGVVPSALPEGYDTSKL